MLCLEVEYLLQVSGCGLVGERVAAGLPKRRVWCGTLEPFQGREQRHPGGDGQRKETCISRSSYSGPPRSIVIS